MQADLEGNSNGIPKKLTNVWPFIVTPAASLKQLSDSIDLCVFKCHVLCI